MEYCGVDTLMNWTSAESYCQLTFGTHLATIKSSIDNANVRIAGSGSVWIGYNDRDNEGTFVWVGGTGDEGYNYTNWQSGEPNENTPNKQDCVIMKTDETWDDTPCSNTRRSVCNAPGII